MCSFFTDHTVSNPSTANLQRALSFLWYFLEATFTLQMPVLMSAIAVGEPPPNEEGWVRSQTSPCRICGGKIGMLTYSSRVLCFFLSVTFHRQFKLISFIFTVSLNKLLVIITCKFYVFSCSFMVLSFEEGVATLIQILFCNVILLFFHPHVP